MRGACRPAASGSAAFLASERFRARPSCTNREQPLHLERAPCTRSGRGRQAAPEQAKPLTRLTSVERAA